MRAALLLTGGSGAVREDAVWVVLSRSGGGAVHIRKFHNTPSPVDKMTHTSENITLPQTSFACSNRHLHLENKYVHVQLSFKPF